MLLRTIFSLAPRLALGIFSVGLVNALPAQAVDVSSTTWYDIIGRDLRFSDARFTSVASGVLSGNTATVDPGSSLDLTADWAFGGFTSTYTYCPACEIQAYIAWVQPSQTMNSSQGFFSRGILDDSWARSGTLNWTTKAPSQEGTYFIGIGATLDYYFHDNVAGFLGGPTSNGPYGNVASFKVVVAPVPLPLMGAGAAFLYSRKLRSRIRLGG